VPQNAMGWHTMLDSSAATVRAKGGSGRLHDENAGCMASIGQGARAMDDSRARWIHTPTSSAKMPGVTLERLWRHLADFYETRGFVAGRAVGGAGDVPRTSAMASNSTFIMRLSPDPDADAGAFQAVRRGHAVCKTDCSARCAAAVALRIGG